MMQTPMNKGSNPPRVSIGMPVYNGEAFLEKAIDSVLAQSFSDIELIISDNGSTDRTETICRRYVEQDPRVSYHRVEKNRGVSWNYNRVFEMARGEYFQWVAHDDMLTPDFLRLSIEALDREPNAVLCQSVINLIDERGDSIGLYESGVYGGRSSSIFRHVVLKPHWCTELLGVIRASALRKVEPYGQYHGADEIMIAELAMQGSFLRIHEPLFLNREHKGRFSASVSIEQHAAWFGAEKAQVRFPLWKVYRRYFEAVRKHQKDRSERMRCYLILLLWWFVNWNAIRMVVDILSSFDPRIFYVASRIKHRLFGSAAPLLRR